MTAEASYNSRQVKVGRVVIRLMSRAQSWVYRRSGGPYQAADGSEWGDNLQRFALLGWMALRLGRQMSTAKPQPPDGGQGKA